MRIVSLKEDFAFKEFMSNETVRKFFLADTLEVPVENIRTVRMMNTFLSRSWRKQKQGILDVKIEFNNDAKVNIEMQVGKRKDWERRNMFYLSKMYCEDLRWGEEYGRLRRCIGISLLDFELTDDEKGHKIYRMRDVEGNDFTDVMELHIIELRKWFSPEDNLSDWVKLFNATTEEELDMIKSDNIGIQTGIRMVREMSLTKRIRAEIEYREKVRRDRVAELAYARDEGIEQGIERGMEQGQELVNTLHRQLIEDERMEDLKRATTDVEFQKKLMTEYGLIK